LCSIFSGLPLFIGISLATGIGPEVVLKALTEEQKKRHTRYRLQWTSTEALNAVWPESAT
jgi:hypothetical protein